MKRVFGFGLGICALALVMCTPLAAHAGEARVAVASNFYPTAVKLREAFSQQSEHSISLSSGSTGKHYAQIKQGAPFDLFLAADDKTPSLLAQAGVGLVDTVTSYALGHLLVWQPSAKSSDAILENLKLGRGHVAIANPKLAPYGRAARQALASLQLEEKTRPRLVMGENIAQTFQFIASGNAESGFVAKSQILATAQPTTQLWSVPTDLHEPIVQQMLIIRDSDAANEFYNFLLSPHGRRIIQAAGYDAP